MRIALLVAAALLAIGAAAWLALSGGPPAAPPAALPGAAPPAGGTPAGGPAAAPGAPGPGGEAPRPPAPSPPPPPRDPEAWRSEKDGVPPRPPGPPTPGSAPGEVLPERVLAPEELERIHGARRKLEEAKVGPVEYRSRALRSVLADLAAKAGIPLELADEALADEPVEISLPEVSVLDALHQVALSRNLRFEIGDGKATVKR